MEPTPIGEVIPRGNLPALLNEPNPNLSIPTAPHAFDAWTELIRTSWALAMLPIVSWSAVMTSTLSAFKTSRY